MDCISATAYSQLDDLAPVQICLFSSRTTEGERFVGQSRMGRIGVGVGVHGGRGDAHGLQCLQNPDGNLSSVGD